MLNIFAHFYLHQRNIGGHTGHVQRIIKTLDRHKIILKLSSSSSEEVTVTAAFLKQFQLKKLRCLILVMKGRRTAACRSEERKWSIGIGNIYDNSVVVRQHLRARAGAARKAIEIREESRPPGRSRLQSNLCLARA